jgi:hypothetical protein
MSSCSQVSQKNEERRREVPDISNIELVYSGTDMALDGGSIVQSYKTRTNSIYELWLKPIKKKQGAFTVMLIVPGNIQFVIENKNDKNVIMDFLVKMRIKYRDNLNVREDIDHALEVVSMGKLSGLGLWNFSKLKDQTDVAIPKNNPDAGKP